MKKRVLTLALIATMALSCLVACATNSVGNNNGAGQSLDKGDAQKTYIVECITNYNADGTVVSKSTLEKETQDTAEYHAVDAEGNLTGITKYAYDKAGNVTKFESLDKDGVELSKIEYTYDEKGNQLEQTNYYNGELWTKTYFVNGQKSKVVQYTEGKETGYEEFELGDAPIKKHMMYTYDEEGNAQSAGYYEEEYDASTRTITSKQYIDWFDETKLLKTIIIVKNENGKTISQKTIVPENSTIEGCRELESRNEYDKDGNCVKTETYKDGVLASWAETTYKVKE